MEDSRTEIKHEQQPSPLDDEFIDDLIGGFEGLWAYEHERDGELRNRVAALLALLETAQEFFWRDVDSGEDVLGGVLFEPPSDETGESCLNVFTRAGAVFERAEHDDFDGLVDAARDLCHFPAELSDAQILAALALREIDWAIEWIRDICVAYQEEITPYIKPLTVFRDEFPDDYFKHETEHRAKAWWFERNKISDSEEFKARAQMLLLLATISRDGVDAPAVLSFVRKQIVCNQQRRQRQVSAAGGKAKRGTKKAHTIAIERLSTAWKITTASAFRVRLASEIEVDKGLRHCEKVSGFEFWIDSADDKIIAYEAPGRVCGAIADEALKKILKRK